MSSQYLPVYVGNALNDNLEALPSILAGKVGRKQILTFCRNLRIAGIGELLMTGQSDEFHLRLHQSGRAYAAWLRNAPDRERRTGNLSPFFDAIAVGDLEAAVEIARYSKHEWMQGVEFEEDFLFVEFLMQYFFLEAPDADCERLLKQYRKALQGSEDVRLALCDALRSADADGFDAALQIYLSERSDHYLSLEEEGGTSGEILSTEGKLCVEGVALARLAESLGIETEEDYLHVPSVAREESARVFRADAWKDL